MKARRPPSRQEGIAVITAMLVVTIATVLAVELAWQTTLDLRRTEGILLRDQAYQYGLGAEAFGAQALEEKLQQQEGTATFSRTDAEQFCRGLRFTIEGGSMTGGACDLQGRFNLNNLVNNSGQHNKVFIDQFRRLLLAVGELDQGLDIDPSTAESIAESAADWIDPDNNAEFNGAEDDTYTGLDPPYRAANFWFTDKTEFRAVRGVTPEIYASVSDYITALPINPGKPTPLNVNTAPMPVLISLGENISSVNAEGWVDDSRKEPFKDTTPFTGFVDPGLSQYLTVTSDYFVMKGLVSIGTTQLEMYSLLEYTGQAVVTRLRRFGVVESGESYGEPAAAADAEATANTDE